MIQTYFESIAVPTTGGKWLIRVLLDLESDFYLYLVETPGIDGGYTMVYDSCKATRYLTRTKAMQRIEDFSSWED